MNSPIHSQLWDHRFGDSRSDAEWRSLLKHVVSSFSGYIGHYVQCGPETLDDAAGAAHSCIGTQVSIPLVPTIGLSYVGRIDIGVNHNDRTSVRAILLLFCNNKRMSVHPKRAPVIEDWFWFDLDREDPTTKNWLLRECMDESGEWEQFMSLADWTQPA